MYCLRQYTLSVGPNVSLRPLSLLAGGLVIPAQPRPLLHCLLLQQEEQILKTIHTRHTGLLQSSSLHYQSSWTSELLHVTLQQNDHTSSTSPVTLWPNEHHGHSNWNQTVELSSVSNNTNFQTNLFTGVPTFDNTKPQTYISWNQFSSVLSSEYH